MAFKATLKGDPRQVAISNGILDLDESKLKFSMQAKDFAKPNLAFDLNLDNIDLDRYLPPPGATDPAAKKKKDQAPASKPKKIDYTPLRKMILNGNVNMGTVKARNAQIQNLNLKVTGKKGIFKISPLELSLYKGAVSALGSLDVQQDIPKSDLNLQIKGIQVGPLMQDVLKKDFLEGALKGKVTLSMTGDDANRIKKTLNGNGDLRFADGAIKGFDIAGMVRNAKAAFGLADKGAERPRTDFSELHAPFTITNGVVKTPGTSLKSPVLRVIASGTADLNNENLDFRVEPKFVSTLKGQGDKKQRAGIMVPVLVSGSFSAPNFRPDLKGMLKKGLEGEIPKIDDLKKQLPKVDIKKEGLKGVEEKTKGLIKSLPFGN
jgi:AsmA protein